MIDVGTELIAAQKALAVRPVVTCFASEARFGVGIPDWESVYSGGAETAMEYDAAVAGDGSLIRVRVNTAAGKFEFQRIADPTDPDDWSGASWAQLVSQGGGPGSGSIFVDPQAPANVYFVYAYGALRRNVRMLTSTDYGATWSAYETVYTYGSGTVEYVAGAMRYAGTAEIVVFICYAGATRDLVMTKRAAGGGAWSAPAAWSLGDIGRCDGFDAVWYEDDFLILLAGAPTGATTARLWWAVYGDGGLRPAGTWAWGVVEQSDVAGFSYVGPRIADADTLRVSWLEAYTGTGAYRRQQLGRPLSGLTWDQLTWLDALPVEFAPTVAYSGALCCFPGESDLYFVFPSKAWHAAVSTATTDLSAKVAGYDYREDHERSECTIVLDNHDDALDQAGADGTTFRSVRVGAQVSIIRGLKVAGDDYTAMLSRFQIEQLEHVCDNKGRKLLILHCLGWLGVLERWHAGRLFQWAGTTLASICATIAARVGLDFGNIGGEGSAFFGTFQPTYAIIPGVSGKVALRHAAELGGDVLRFDGWSKVLYKELVRTEAAVYDLGGAGEHPIILGSFVEGAMAENVFQVYGSADALASSMEFAGLALVGTRRRKIVEGLYATVANAATRAAGERERAHADSARGWVEVFPVHGVELWDVLSITSARHDFTDRRYRVVGIRERWDWLRGYYRQRLALVALE